MIKTCFSVDFCSFVMILIIMTNFKKFNRNSSASFFFRWILIALAAILADDALAFAFLGNKVYFARVIATIANSVYFILSAIIPYLWLRYVYCKLHDDKDMSIELGGLCSLPMVLLIIISAMTPFTNHLFDVDRYGLYHRGPFFAVQYVIIFGYIFVASMWALLKRREQGTKEQKQEYMYLAMFAVLPLVGSILQIVGQDLILAWPCTALSALMIYLKFNNHEISIDALTGLNNRGTFNRYIQERCQNVEDLRRGEAIYLTLIDVNDFKKINDGLGHNIGDLALKKTADVLKNIFGNTKAFISRYGGDEFAIVNISKNAMEVDEHLEELNKQLEGLYTIKAFPCKIQLSYGTAKYGTYQTFTIEHLIEEADKRMYAKKVAMKREQAKKHDKEN